MINPSKLLLAGLTSQLKLRLTLIQSHAMNPDSKSSDEPNFIELKP